ncbi:uncharacterized protein LOC132759297 [Ruditapes philippinarum]|uniref:uncharacterized protein LOC132759297 n=1 Tax=Ruditapes philippinarum TaxID=129788 RepID=UPI00295AB658|nr:uncharacterized protein LOC132759297 [Ruditapes philippinarum]
MLLLLYLNHVIFVCLAITTITDAAASGDDIFNSVERDNPDTLKMVLKQMEVMQAKITKLEESEASLKLSLSALMGTQKLCMSQIDALTYQINTLKPKIMEIGNKSKPLKKTTEQMDITDGEQVTEKLESEQNMHHTEYGIKNSSGTKREKEIRQTSESVFFSAYLDHVMSNLGQDQPVVYNMILQNEGGSYSGSSGIFHVPISGVFLFSWSTSARVLPGGQTYDVWVKLVVNGVHQIGAAAESQVVKDDNQGSSTIILRLKKGDEVWTASQNAGSSLFGSDNERTTSFTGVLLYPS